MTTGSTKPDAKHVFACAFVIARLPVSRLYVQQTRDGQKNAFMAAEKAYGVWQAYPRDDAAAALITDGRWTKPPSPVDWVLMPQIAAPLGVRRAPDTGVAVVLMAPPEDAFAVFTPDIWPDSARGRRNRAP